MGEVNRNHPWVRTQAARAMAELYLERLEGQADAAAVRGHMAEAVAAVGEQPARLLRYLAERHGYARDAALQDALEDVVHQMNLAQGELLKARRRFAVR